MSYIVPIGPYHPALEEPVHARLNVEGEEIKSAEVFIGYNHRGIEKLAQQKNYIQTLVMVERVCGICSHSHSFAMATEQIAQMEVPKRGQYLRVITAELERLHSHYLWLGIALHIIGHDSLFMHTWDDREAIMDILEELTGNRVNYGMVTIGGARRDISAVTAKNINAMLDKIEASNNKLVEILLADKSVALRTQGVGVLTTEDAIRIGAVGPQARASALAVDVRKDAPYICYEDFDFNKVVYNTCDVFSRVVIRVLENVESIKINGKEQICAIPIISSRLLIPYFSITAGSDFTISLHANGSVKFAAPTSTAVAPASIISITSSGLLTPPIPTTGILTAFAV